MSPAKDNEKFIMKQKDSRCPSWLANSPLLGVSANPLFIVVTITKLKKIPSF